MMSSNIPSLRGTIHSCLLELRFTTSNIPQTPGRLQIAKHSLNNGLEKQAFFIMQKAYNDNGVGKPNKLNQGLPARQGKE